MKECGASWKYALIVAMVGMYAFRFNTKAQLLRSSMDEDKLEHAEAVASFFAPVLEYLNEEELLNPVPVWEQEPLVKVRNVFAIVTSVLLGLFELVRVIAILTRSSRKI